MNPNEFRKIFLQQMACILILFALFIYYLYRQQPSVTAVQNIVLNSNLQVAKIDGAPHKSGRKILLINIVEDRPTLSVFVNTTLDSGETKTPVTASILFAAGAND